MHRLLASITAATVLAHALLGCCAHAAQVSSCCEASHAVCGDHDHEHDSGVNTPADEQSPEKDHSCCRVKCQWMAPDAPGDLATALLSHAAIFDADQTASLCAATSEVGEISPHDSLPAPPLRSHLVLGVLLI